MKKQQAHFVKNGNLNTSSFLAFRLKPLSQVYAWTLILCLSICIASCANRDEPEAEVIEPKTLDGNVRISNK